MKPLVVGFPSVGTSGPPRPSRVRMPGPVDSEQLPERGRFPQQSQSSLTSPTPMLPLMHAALTVWRALLTCCCFSSHLPWSACPHPACLLCLSSPFHISAAQELRLPSDGPPLQNVLFPVRLSTSSRQGLPHSRTDVPPPSDVF